MVKSIYKGMSMILVIQNIDNSVLLFIKNNMHSYIMDKAMVTITSLGNGGVVWIVIAVLLMDNDFIFKRCTLHIYGSYCNSVYLRNYKKEF